MKKEIRKGQRIDIHKPRGKCKKCGKTCWWNNNNICISCNIKGRIYNGFCKNCKIECDKELCIPCYLYKRKEDIDLSKVSFLSYPL
jgi:hypothetical protein